MSQDPYYFVRNEVAQALEVSQLKQMELERLLSGGENAATSRSVRTLRRAITRDLRKVEGSLSDLSMTVDVVRKNRENYPAIDDREIEGRVNFLNQSRRTLRELKEAVDGEAMRDRIRADEAVAAQRYRSRETYGARTPMEHANTEFIRNEQAVTQLRLKEQDDTLVELGQSVDRVGTMAETIHEELGEQNRMLDAFEADLERAAEEMGFMMGKIAKLLKTKDRYQIWLIIFLSLVMLILLFLVVYG